MTSQDERDRAITYLEQTKISYIEATAGLTDAQWTFKPAPESWSVAECSEHLAVVEERVLAMIQRVARGPAASPEELAQARGKEDLIGTVVAERRGRAQAPEFARPANRWPAREECIGSFASARDRTIEYARSTADGLRDCLAPHFALGPLDGYQWLLFLAAHSERHLRQLNEVKAAPGFPR